MVEHTYRGRAGPSLPYPSKDLPNPPGVVESRSYFRYTHARFWLEPVVFAPTLTDRVLDFAAKHRVGFEPFYTEIPGLSVVRQSQPTEVTPVLYQPIFCLVLQGAKQTSLGEELITFSQGRSGIVGLELPTFARVCEASNERPYVAVALQIDMTLIKELAAEINGFMSENGHASERKEHVSAIAAGEADDAIVNAMERLFGLLGKPAPAAVLHPLLMREIHFWLLSASHGSLLRQLVKANSHAARISEAIIRIRRNFTEPLRIPDLARAVGMSDSAFHEHFKSMCGTTPLQFQKRLRLMEARRLLITENRSVSAASAAVGYESPTQFSREFTRTFGSPPREHRYAASFGESADARLAISHHV
jgi:AraC-like DNA-binding protein